MLQRRLSQMAVPPEAVIQPSAPPPPVAVQTIVFAPPPPRVREPPADRRDWEELLTAKWGVWLGAVALLLAGVFLVRYAVDEGLLGPGVRCIGLLVLGAALIAGGDWLHRRPPARTDIADYAPQALAAGGVGMLFGAAYMAAVLDALVPHTLGFALMALAALSGLALSLRLGQLVAAVGLVGAFATPLLVQTTDPSLPGLFAYLLFITAAAWAVVRLTAWVWLGWAAIIAGAFWVVVAGFAPASGAWAAALFVPAAAALSLALLPGTALNHPVGRQLAWVPMAALGLAGLLLSLATPDVATRAGVLLLAPFAIVKAATEPRLDRLPWLAALLFLLLITAWGLPAWQPTGEPILVNGQPMVTLPRGWLPAALQPLLTTASFMAAGFAAAGLWRERRSGGMAWAALPAAVPVLTLAILYARVMGFQTADGWAGIAVLLAAGSTVAAALARRAGRLAFAGAHAAGATAALALGCAMLLSAQWLTLAYALFLPALAWIEARADLLPLRRVALAVATVALVRLLLLPDGLLYVVGERPVLNSLVPVYLVAAVAFAVSARMFLRRGDDLAVAVLELGAAAFVTTLVKLEITVAATHGRLSLFWHAALNLSGMATLALVSLRLALRSGRPMLGWVWRIQGGLALVGGIVLLVINPAFLTAPVGMLPVLNALLPAYLLPGLVAAVATRLVPAAARPALLGYALVGVFAWLTLEVRHDFHPARMAFGAAPIVAPELWAWSGVWLVYGLVLMAAGLLTADRVLRLAALALFGLVSAKVFLVDMAGLVGLYRVLSFFGLGLTLIGLGAAYRRFTVTPRPS